jgi:hypothetical protein
MVRASFGRWERRGRKRCSLVISVTCSVHDTSYPLSGVSHLSPYKHMSLGADEAHIVTQLNQCHSIEQ